MPVIYELYLADQGGSRIALLDAFTSLSWARRVNETGTFKLILAPEKFDRSLFGVDRRLEIWRQPEGGAKHLIMVGLLRYLRRRSIGDKHMIEIAGPDANDLLRTRIIAAAAGSTGSNKSGTADDVMKEYVDENLGGSAAAGRDMTGNGFSIQSDLTLGPAVEKAASRRWMDDVLREISADAVEQGTPIYFDIAHPTPSTFQFRTYLNQRGIDRSYPDSSNPITLSEEFGTLVNPDLVQDWREEVTYVYGAGQGIKAGRITVEVEDATRSGLSIFNRREGLFDGRSYSTSARLTSAARKRLNEGRPRRTFNAEIVDTVNNRFGKDWGFGDKVTAVYDGEQINVRIQAASALFRDGAELLVGRLSHVE